MAFLGNLFFLTFAILISETLFAFNEDSMQLIEQKLSKLNILPLQNRIASMKETLSEAQSSKCCPNIESLLNRQLGILYYENRQFLDAIHHFDSLPLTDSNRWHPLALCTHYLGDFATAANFYRQAIANGQRNAQVEFDFAVTLQNQGKIIEANKHYNEAVTLRYEFPAAWLNIAALHHKHGSIEMAIPNYQKALKMPNILNETRIMTIGNLGCAFEQLGRVADALKQFEHGLSIANDTYKKEDKQRIESMLLLLSHIRRAKETICNWENYENALYSIVKLVDTHQLSKNFSSALLPFDTLLLPLDPLWQKKVAVQHSRQWNHFPPLLSPGLSSEMKKLKIGYMSYDFNDHPTSHLMEGLFEYHDRFRYSIFAYSYGKEDNSTYRLLIKSKCDFFCDMAQLGHYESAEKIAEDQVHILIDAQGHTKGARQEIVAYRPAPIIVNYLVYAGTMGADFIDYFIVDKYVAPVENQGHFTEKLVYMPGCYQVNYYPQRNIANDIKGVSRRGDWGLPERAFVFTNFNKNDKIEPSSYLVWMNILRQVPNSVLWLLEPSSMDQYKELKKNLLNEALAQGVAADRLVFAKRVSKRRHVERHRHADLFFDTFVYGAHSTATDALRGGLPVITLADIGFPSRVGNSLLNNLDQGYLVTRSKKEFEDLAVQLAANPRILMRIRTELLSATVTQQLFQTHRYTYYLERVYESIWDVYVNNISRRLHLMILPN